MLIVDNILDFGNFFIVQRSKRTEFIIFLFFFLLCFKSLFLYACLFLPLLANLLLHSIPRRCMILSIFHARLLVEAKATILIIFFLVHVICCTPAITMQRAATTIKKVYPAFIHLANTTLYKGFLQLTLNCSAVNHLHEIYLIIMLIERCLK